jgi:2-polyprenyl-3-methyl-5-hydroxy-6-metoxy-1,4-benzoquinol methylase
MQPDQAIEYSYKTLEPFSKRFSVDKKRLLFSINILHKELKGVRDKNILDVGCSIGLGCLALQQMGARATGIDKYIFEPQDELFHIEDLDSLREIWRSQNLDIQNLDFFYQENKLKSGDYDVVMNEAVIEHLRDPKGFLDKMFSMARPGGYVLISTPNFSTLLQRFRFLFGRSPMWNLKDFYNMGESFTGHWREYTVRELEQMCEWSGFEVVETWNVNMLTPFKWNPRKMFRFFVKSFSELVPGSRDTNFILCKRPDKRHSRESGNPAVI